VKKDVLLCGVGGQGIVLASRILAQAALNDGLDVKVSEVHGMSQRGGSVYTMVRMGEKVYSPLISRGQADIMVSLEMLETLRWLPFLKPSGKIVLNLQKIQPLSVVLGGARYPDVINYLKKNGLFYQEIQATQLAREAGTSRAANVVMLGATFPFLSLTKDSFKKALGKLVKPQFIKANLRAFELGLKASQAFLD
jgi:indolepyruvate ferredoxin oxidoreductase beta subunit